MFSLVFFLFLLKKRDYYYLKFRLISYIIIEEIRTQKIDTLHKFVIFLSLDEQKNRKKDIPYYIQLLNRKKYSFFL